MKPVRTNKLYFVLDKRGSPWRLADGQLWSDHQARGAAWLTEELNSHSAFWAGRRKVVQRGRPWRAVWLRLPTKVIKLRCLPVTDSMVAAEIRRTRAR